MKTLGDIIKAHDAEKLEFVNQVKPFADLYETVDKIARRLVDSLGITLANIKSGLNHNLNSDLAAALEFEAIN